MPNPYFKFKQFTIYQDQCALKVCTDACILGAWFARKKLDAPGILDIGSGTGLLMLMLAQHHTGRITGIELDPSSAAQSALNIAQSQWNQRLQILEGDARTYAFPQKFDFIISNPPFFEGDLQSGSEQDNRAKHSSDLTLTELIDIIDKNLLEQGSFGILLPFHRKDYFVDLAQGKGFHLQDSLWVRQTPRHPFFRAVLHFGRKAIAAASSAELTIKDEKGGDTAAFIQLLRDYYLYL